MLEKLPPELLLVAILPLLRSPTDYFSVQTTSKTLKKFAGQSMQKDLEIMGHKETGLQSLITGATRPNLAALKLIPFARSGNVQAYFLLGKVVMYGMHDVKIGLLMF